MKFSTGNDIFFPLAAGNVKDIFALRSWFIAHRSSLIVHRTAGAGLGQEPGYWTVPAPGALFVTGGRFWPILRQAQDRTGKVLALRGLVGW
ncbi:MAG: hypothetical protein GTN53_03315 [Candidatus Aminicenantes bacterium]|nr:hypothetical protein [Candidatus Aminicenantes bacterium]NIQ65518.1 hypothetical protein [Candidatus Aminicenantes bacterium]NIT21518.1 hypothetical protein [Candidatus Aminicenantes bacterium]